MSKAEILNELSKLRPEERRQIFDRLWELEERDLLEGAGPTPAEKALLDSELKAYEAIPGAGAPWEAVEEKLLGPPNEQQ